MLQVRNEIAVLKRVSMGHQNILTLVDYFETMNNRTLSLPSLLDRLAKHARFSISGDRPSARRRVV